MFQYKNNKGIAAFAIIILTTVIFLVIAAIFALTKGGTSIVPQKLNDTVKQIQDLASKISSASITEKTAPKVITPPPLRLTTATPQSPGTLTRAGVISDTNIERIKNGLP